MATPVMRATPSCSTARPPSTLVASAFATPTSAPCSTARLPTAFAASAAAPCAPTCWMAAPSM
eukprot:4867786-Alexandrium_andersonii.AAC.1